MKYTTALLWVFCLNLPFCFSQKVDLNYYLPDISYDTNIPTPEAFLGYQIGEWHIRHDQLVAYMKEIARLSPRITIEEYAHSHEQRPLVLLAITAEKNHKQLDKILENHQKLCDPKHSDSINIQNAPAVVYQGYTVHGNEASGANAAPLVLYYLAAGQSSTITELLDETIILLDPCYNPDGMNRFASWVNRHKNKNLTNDPQDREYQEVWPSGRTNHYWFDLNRDWLLVQHPESQGRIAQFQKWKPNILTDHHEMGPNSTYFFQPGIPSRTNPITPAQNQELTGKIATYHAKALDAIGSLYYTRESFDDFYYGKGSTYPDVHGCIGILFEQASSRGHLQQTENGLLSFPFTIRNQVITSLSTQQAALEMRKELLSYQRDFYKNAAKEAQSDSRKGFVFSADHDISKANAFTDLLRQHDIDVYKLKKDVKTDNQTFSAQNSYVVPSTQAQYRLIRTIFETQTTFQDSLFYDVSAWTLPLAFNLKYASVSNFSKGKRIEASIPNVGTVIGGQSNYAYVLPWDDYHSPTALYALQQQGLRTKVAAQTFTAKTMTETQDFDYGAVLISVQQQFPKTANEVYHILEQVAQQTGVSFHAIASGLTPVGMDLGSRNMEALRQPKVLLLVGEGVNAYDAGEVWHLLDQRYNIPISMIETYQFNRINLDKYNTIIFVDGSYHEIHTSKLKTWVKNGGTLITYKRAATWASAQGLGGVKTKSVSTPRIIGHRPYNKINADNGRNYIGGAIFEMELDLTHPIAYGYTQSKIPTFRRGTLFFEPTKNKYATPASYTNQPLLSGYISKENATTIKNSAVVVVTGIGKGHNISFADNTNFRGFWWGTNKLLANAIFFGSTIQYGTTESVHSSVNQKDDSEALEHGHQH